MTDLLHRLFETARDVRERAYAPYSGYGVGAALCTEGAEIFAGANVENAAYPVGLCAEAAAIAAMVAAGGRRIEQIVVVAAATSRPVAPCGACRQRLSEFMVPHGLVHAGDPHGLRARWSMADLLPAAFGPGHLSHGEGRSFD